MSETEDRRSQRSRRVLWEALLGLLQETDWGAINVQMICARAGVARSTFYAHFQTKQDLLDAGFAEGGARLATMSGDGGLAASISWLVDHLASSVGFHRRLQGSTAGHAIMVRFRQLVRDRIAQDIACQETPTASRSLDFAVGGLFAVLESWLATGCREDPALITADLIGRIERAVH